MKEETHYYPHGLPMGDSEASAHGFVQNRHKHQGNEYIREVGLDWMDFHARQYDPQIGRFLGVDPLADVSVQDRFSPFAAMGNNPVRYSDPTGLLFDEQRDNNVNILDPYELLRSFSNSTLNFIGLHGMDFNVEVMPAAEKLSEEQIDEMNDQIKDFFEGSIPDDMQFAGGSKDKNSKEGKEEEKSDEELGELLLGGEEHVNDFDGVWGKVKWFLTGGVVGQGTYDWNGNFKHITPIGGAGGLELIGGGRILKAAKGGKELFKFGGSAGRHMAEPGRAVPIQILEQAIKGSKGVADPGGSKALMHSIEMWRNGKRYQLDVLYNKSTNTIWHFQYSPIKP